MKVRRVPTFFGTGGEGGSGEDQDDRMEKQVGAHTGVSEYPQQPEEGKKGKGKTLWETEGFYKTDREGRPVKGRHDGGVGTVTSILPGRDPWCQGVPS